MLRHRLSCTVFALVSSLAVGYAVKACSSPELVETFDEKSEWSTLQAIEFTTRDEVLREPVVRKMDEREVLGVKGASGQNIWILLKTEAPPFYKQMPGGQYNVPAGLVDRLAREKRLSYTVAAVLRSHVAAPAGGAAR
jgi:hypothetical protein